MEFGRIENKESSVEDFASFFNEQQNRKKPNKREGEQSALQKAYEGITTFVNTKR